MTKAQKTQLISSLAKDFSDSNAILVCDYKGLGVKDFEDLRAQARQSGIRVQVIKNTLAKIALKDANIQGLDFKENNVFLWGEDQITLAKIACKFSERVGDKFVLKMGYFEKQVVDVAHITALSKLPSRDELIGMLLSVWTAPARYFVTGLDNLRKSKESQ